MNTYNTWTECDAAAIEIAKERAPLINEDEKQRLKVKLAEFCAKHRQVTVYTYPTHAINVCVCVLSCMHMKLAELFAKHRQVTI